MHSLTLTFVTFAAALSIVATSPAASSQNTTLATPKPAEASIHKVIKGETMWSIAQRHQTSVGEIMQHNNLSTHDVREGMTLKIPGRNAVVPNKTSTPAIPRPTQRTSTSTHTVQEGETFWKIAANLNISPDALAKANPTINPDRIHPKMELNIPAKPTITATKTTPTTTAPTPAKTPTPAPTPTPTIKNGSEHTLAAGETFYSISKSRGVKLDDLIAANPTLKPERLRPGTKIIIPNNAKIAEVKPTPKPITPTETKPTNTPTPTPKRHTVSTNDSITSIAKQYSVSTEDLLKENKLTEKDSIYIDDVLIIPNKTIKNTTASTTPQKSSPTSKQPQTTAKPKPTAPTTTTASTTVKPTPTPITPKPKTNLPLEVAPDGSVRSYIITAGETEESICEAFGISKKDLFEHNKLPMGSKLRPGDEIMIPATTKTVVSR